MSDLPNGSPIESQVAATRQQVVALSDQLADVSKKVDSVGRTNWAAVGVCVSLIALIVGAGFTTLGAIGAILAYVYSAQMQTVIAQIDSPDSGTHANFASIRVLQSQAEDALNAFVQMDAVLQREMRQEDARIAAQLDGVVDRLRIVEDFQKMSTGRNERQDEQLRALERTIYNNGQK